MEEALKKAIWLLTTPAAEENNAKARELAREASDEAIQKHLETARINASNIEEMERRVAELTHRLDRLIAVLTAAVSP